LLWDRDDIEVVHLLGVAAGRLLFTTQKGMKAVPVATGADRGGWTKPDGGGKLPPFGRGFLAGGWVYWPTVDPEFPLRNLNVNDGSARKDGEFFDLTRFHLLKQTRGNLTFAEGCLAVAGVEHLYVFVPEERFLSRRKAQAQRRPSARNLFRLARAEEGAGQEAQALEHFARAAKAPLGENDNGVPVRDLARAARYELLLRLATGQEAKGDWDKAATWLTRAADADFPPPARLQARVRLAELWTRAGRYERAVAAWQSLLGDCPCRQGLVNIRRGKPRRAGSLAAERIGDLIRRHGVRVYESFEKKARDQLAGARGAQQITVLQRLVAEFPNASVVGPALLRLAKLHAQAGRPARAAQAYQRLLSQEWPGVKKDEALAARVALAQAYEQQHCWHSARAAWQVLADRHGDCVCPAIDRDRKLRDVVASQLRKPAYLSSPEAPPAELTFPMLRAWQWPCGQLLVPEGGRWSGAAGQVVFMVRGGQPHWRLCCREVRTGQLRWEQKLPHRPTWAGAGPCSAIVAGPDGVHCLSLADGSPLWEFRRPGLPLVNPVEKADSQLAAFRLTGSSFFCLQDGRRLFALDAASGRILWSHWAPAAQLRPLYPGGRFNSLYYADDRWLVVQTGGLRRWVINVKTGQRVHETAADRAFWQRPPQPVGGGRLCLVPDPGRVVLFDPATGKDLWKYNASPRSASTLVTGEPPRVLGDGKTLLVLLARNYGYQLERLNPRTGARLWKGEARLVSEAIDPDRAGFSRRAVFYVSRRVLWARSLAGGKLLWSRPLAGPVGSWRAVHCGAAVLAYPVRLRPELTWSWVPLGNGGVAVPVRARPEVTIPVHCCNPKDGRLMQRLNFLARDLAFAVQVFPNRLVVGVDGRAWGLVDAEKKV
jgi:tetratricopeptide (TPR) repeat protein